MYSWAAARHSAAASATPRRLPASTGRAKSWAEEEKEGRGGDVEVRLGKGDSDESELQRRGMKRKGRDGEVGEVVEEYVM